MATRMFFSRLPQPATPQDYTGYTISSPTGDEGINLVRACGLRTASDSVTLAIGLGVLVPQTSHPSGTVIYYLRTIFKTFVYTGIG